MSMIRLPGSNRFSPIGVDIGSRSVKLVQFKTDFSHLVDASRWDVPAEVDEVPGANTLSAAIRKARNNRRFRGKRAVLCLNSEHLFLQNVRVNKAGGLEMDTLVQQEVAGRLPFPVAESEIRYVEAADIRQGDSMMREVIAMAVHRPVLDSQLRIVEAAGLRPVAVDVEPLALHRSFARQLRRDEDRTQRTLLLQIGYTYSIVVIAEAEEVLFIKYIPIGGKDMDDAVARHLEMPVSDASHLRKHNGDRRSDLQDPEIASSVAEATRPVLDRLNGELAMCVRYHSVTFRGKPLVRLVLGGGEATPTLAEALGQRLNLKHSMSDPLRGFSNTTDSDRRTQWDIAAGLAMRSLN